MHIYSISQHTSATFVKLFSVIICRICSFAIDIKILLFDKNCHIVILTKKGHLFPKTQKFLHYRAISKIMFDCLLDLPLFVMLFLKIDFRGIQIRGASLICINITVLPQMFVFCNLEISKCTRNQHSPNWFKIKNVKLRKNQYYSLYFTCNSCCVRFNSFYD